MKKGVGEHSLPIFPDLVEVWASSFECFALAVIPVKTSDTGVFQIPVPFEHGKKSDRVFRKLNALALFSVPLLLPGKQLRPWDLTALSG
jgi:hypothetical protein